MPSRAWKGYLGVAKESTWGTKVVSGMKFQPFLSESIAIQQARRAVRGIMGARVPQRNIGLGKTVAGAVSFEADVEGALPLFLKSILPTETLTDDGVGNGGQHAFTPADAPLTGLTLQIGRDVDVADYFGGIVSSLSMSAALGEVLQCQAEMVFTDGSLAQTPQTPTYSTEQPMVYHTGSVTIAGGAAVVRSFSLNIQSGNLANRGKIGSALVNALTPLGGPMTVTGEVQLYFDNLTELNKFLAQTASSLVIELTGTAVGTTTRKVKIEVPQIFYNGNQPVVNSETEEVFLNLPFEAIKTGSGSPNELVKVTVNNSVRTAY